MRHPSLLLATLLALAAPLAAQEYRLVGGIAAGSALNPGALVEIDQATYAGTVLGDSIDSGGITGLAVTSTGRLYAVVRPFQGSLEADLMELDPITGAILSQVRILLNGQNVDVADLAIHPGTDVLYTFGNGVLYTVDVTTGAATAVGPPLAAPFAGLAFRPSGTLYVIFSDTLTPQLLEVDPADASVLSSTAYGTSACTRLRWIRPAVSCSPRAEGPRAATSSCRSIR
ncbi:MAG: hypothetical protein AAF682_24940 [Planctomycetota bacterium]